MTMQTKEKEYELTERMDLNMPADLVTKYEKIAEEQNMSPSELLEQVMISTYRERADKKDDAELVITTMKQSLNRVEETVQAGSLLEKAVDLYCMEVEEMLSMEIQSCICTMAEALGCNMQENGISSRNGKINWSEETVYDFLAAYVACPASLKNTMRELFTTAFLEEDDMAEQALYNAIEETLLDMKKDI